MLRERERVCVCERCSLIYSEWKSKSGTLFSHIISVVNTDENKDVRFLKIAHFEKFLEIISIYDLDKNVYDNSHCVNAFQASRYLCFGQKNYVQFLVCGDMRVDNL